MATNSTELLLPLPEPIEDWNNHSNSHYQHLRHMHVVRFPPFQPLKLRRFYFVHHMTSAEHMTTLIEQAEKTMTFSIATERNSRNQEIIFIKIEFIQSEQLKSSIVFFELPHLPVDKTILSVMIKKLLQIIFLSSKKFYTWHNGKQDLKTLLCNEYLTELQLQQLNIIELHNPFKSWYNKTFKHNDNCPVPSVYKDDTPYCTCPYRPYKNINNNWTIDMATKCVFNEFIYRFRTTADRARQYNTSASASYCSAITKLAMVIELDWSIEQLCQFKTYHQRK